MFFVAALIEENKVAVFNQLRMKRSRSAVVVCRAESGALGE